MNGRCWKITVLIRSSSERAVTGLTTISVTPASRASMTPVTLGEAGQHDDRQERVDAVGRVADQLGELHAVQRRHLEVDDGDVGLPVAQDLQASAPSMASNGFAERPRPSGSPKRSTACAGYRPPAKSAAFRAPPTCGSRLHQGKGRSRHTVELPRGLRSLKGGIANND
jgi:hypothetical protein